MAKTSITIKPSPFFRPDWVWKYVSYCQEQFTKHYELHELYSDGVRWGWLDITYPEFEDLVLNRVQRERPRKFRGRRWDYDARRAQRHSGQKYVRNLDHQKKSKQEKAARKAWEIHSGVRIKRPHYYRQNYKKFYKKMSQKQHRQYVRSVLASGNYERLSQGNETIHFFLDPWHWD